MTLVSPAATDGPAAHVAPTAAAAAAASTRVAGCVALEFAGWPGAAHKKNLWATGKAHEIHESHEANMEDKTREKAELLKRVPSRRGRVEFCAEEKTRRAARR